MARLPRIRLPGYPFHVVIRGNDRRRIFVGDGDRIFFHRTLLEAGGKYGAQVHAYVFMPNHVHLLVTGGTTESISKAVQCLGRRYVGYFNFLHKRTGTLWESRFWSCVVDAERYFFTCQRYIELNPVRAGICAGPEDFAWSSYRRYAHGRADDLVTPHSLHAEHQAFGPAYQGMFAETISTAMLERIRDTVRHGWPWAIGLFAIASRSNPDVAASAKAWGESRANLNYRNGSLNPINRPPRCA